MRLMALATAGALSIALAGPAVAESDHDRWHPVYETWQRNDGKGSCCNRFDCRSVAYRPQGEGFEIQIAELGNSWHGVPAKTILPFSSFDENAHACYMLEWCTVEARRVPCRPNIFCVVLPMTM